jgi:hypothetical protein
LHVAFHLPYVWDYMANLGRQQAEF